jgi:hypothetical protein
VSPELTLEEGLPVIFEVACLEGPEFDARCFGEDTELDPYGVLVGEVEGRGDPGGEDDGAVRGGEFADADVGGEVVAGVEEAECQGLGEVCVLWGRGEELFEGGGREEDSV